MAITMIAGQVSGMRMDTATGVNVNVNAGTASTYTTTKMNFRVANRPAVMKMPINLTNGDMVTAGGIQNPGEFEVLALRNHTTNIIYWIPSLPLWVHILIGVLGFMTLAILVGFFIIPAEIFFWFYSEKKKKTIEEARQMIENAPEPASVNATPVLKV